MKTISKLNLTKPFKFKTKNINKIFGDENIILNINWYKFDIKITKKKNKFILKTKEKKCIFDWDNEKIKLEKYLKEINETGELKLSFPIKRKDLKTFSNIYNFKIKCIEDNNLVLFKITDKPMIIGDYDEEVEFDGPLFGSRNRDYDEEIEDFDGPLFGSRNRN